MLSYSGLEGISGSESKERNFLTFLGLGIGRGELVQLHFTRVRSCLQAFAKNELVPPGAPRPITALPSPPPLFCSTVMAVSPCNKRRLDANILLEQ